MLKKIIITSCLLIAICPIIAGDSARQVMLFELQLLQLGTINLPASQQNMLQKQTNAASRAQKTINKKQAAHHYKNHRTKGGHPNRKQK